MSSLSESTMKQYNSNMKKWWLFAQENSIDPLRPDPQNLLIYLQKLLDQGSSYSALGTARSSVSFLVHGDRGSLGQHNLIVRFMKGVARKRPPHPRYASTWDPRQLLEVIEKMEPLDALSLEELGIKVLGLILLATGQRLQTIHFFFEFVFIFKCKVISVKLFYNYRHTESMLPFRVEALLPRHSRVVYR